MTIWFGLALAVVLLAIILYQWRLAGKARRAEGQAVPELGAEIESRLRERGKALLYFHSPHCIACRSMTPQIELLAARHDNVFKLDVASSQELARRLSIMATPTTMLLADGKIAKVVLGAISGKRLEALLA